MSTTELLSILMLQNRKWTTYLKLRGPCSMPSIKWFRPRMESNLHEQRFFSKFIKGVRMVDHWMRSLQK
ncbi:hypothetical protein S83_046605 [Arachis hypogaea]